MCYEDGDGSVSSGAVTEEDDVDDENATKSLTQMIADFQTLSIKKELSKDDVISIRVNDVQVTTLQSMMESQPLVLQQWAHYYGHLLMEARSNVDGVAVKIKKLHDDDVKNKNSSTGTTKFRAQFRKGTEEEFLEESAFF